MVPLKEYERVKNECGMWQQRFYEANDQLNRIQSQRGFSQQGEVYMQGVSQ